MALSIMCKVAHLFGNLSCLVAAFFVFSAYWLRIDTGIVVIIQVATTCSSLEHILLQYFVPCYAGIKKIILLLQLKIRHNFVIKIVMLDTTFTFNIIVSISI